MRPLPLVGKVEKLPAHEFVLLRPPGGFRILELHGQDRTPVVVEPPFESVHAAQIRTSRASTSAPKKLGRVQAHSYIQLPQGGRAFHKLHIFPFNREAKFISSKPGPLEEAGALLRVGKSAVMHDGPQPIMDETVVVNHAPAPRKPWEYGHAENPKEPRRLLHTALVNEGRRSQPERAKIIGFIPGRIAKRSAARKR